MAYVHGIDIGALALAAQPAERTSPQRRLMAAVLLQAVRDYVELDPSKLSPGELRCEERFARFEEVSAYFFEDRGFDQPLSAESICEVVGIGIDRIRRVLKEGFPAPVWRAA